MRTYIFLDNGQSVQTTDNTPEDIAGLINAGTVNIYTCTDVNEGAQVHIVVGHIVSTYAK